MNLKLILKVPNSSEPTYNPFQSHPPKHSEPKKEQGIIPALHPAIEKMSS